MQSQAVSLTSAPRRTGRQGVGSLILPVVISFLVATISPGISYAQSGSGTSGGGTSSGSGSGSTGTGATGTGSTGTGTTGSGATGTGASGSGSSTGTSADWTSVQGALAFQGTTASDGVLKVEFVRQDGPFTENTYKQAPAFIASGSLAFYMSNAVPLNSTATSTGSTGSTGTSASGSTGSGSTGNNTTGATTTGTGTGSTASSGSTGSGSFAGLVTGEIPLREKELANFLQAMERSNIGVSAIVNHFILENPRLIFVHIEAAGDTQQIASSIRKAMNATSGNFREITGADSSETGLDRDTITSTVAYGGMAMEHGGVLMVTVPRPEQFSNCALSIYQANGANSTSGTGTTSGAGGTGTGASGTGTTGTSASGGTTGTSATGSTGSATGSTGSTTGTTGSTTGTTGSTTGTTGSAMGPALTASNTCLSNAMQATNSTGSASGGSTGTTGTGTTGTGTSTTGTTTSTTGTSTSGTGSTTSGSTSSTTDMAFPAELGAASMFMFERGGGGSIDVVAEFALLATEVQPTIQKLREAGFRVSAAHNHFLNENPRLFFLHAYGQGSAASLSQVIRTVLDQNAQTSGTYAGNGAYTTSGTGSTGSTATGSTTSSSGPGF